MSIIYHSEFILTELISFNLTPAQLYIMRIIYLNDLPMHLWKLFYEYLSKDDITHINIKFNGKQFRLCFKFNIMHNATKCIACEPKAYYTCYKCNIVKLIIQ